jgi:hypothetical protein
LITRSQLPLSFLAAFFAINIAEFPRDADGLSLGYVSKYMCKTRQISLRCQILSVTLVSISVAIIAPSIIIAFNLQNIEDYLKRHGKSRQISPCPASSASGGTGPSSAGPSSAGQGVAGVPRETSEADSRRKQKLFDEEQGGSSF